MAPSAANLFHPKKPVKREPAERSVPPRNAPPKRPTPNVKNEDDSEDIKASLPEGPYTEFKLVSCDRHGWKYDVMKFESRKTVDIMTWQRPVKLNRKVLKRPEDSGLGLSTERQAVGPMLGPDGKPVVGVDGRTVMVDIEGKPIHANNGTVGSSSAAAGNKGKEADGKDKKKKFQKKTRQVFLVPEEVRQLRKEERFPWVVEDGSGKEVWVGMMEEASKSNNHALFMPATDHVFKFVPAHRWYKFQKRPSHIIPTLEEAEKLMALMQKNKDPERWLLHKRNGQGPSAATSAIFKAQAEGRTLVGQNSLVHTAGQSLGPGGRRLKTVDSGMRGLFEEDDEEGVDLRRKREKEYGGEGDLDELEFEEEFADDEEVADVDETKDEEAKEMEERLKREYKNANKTREGYIDEDDSEDEAEHLTGAGKAMKKLVRKVDKNAAYDSDDEKNPYASSEEEEEEEEPQPVETGAQPQAATRSNSQARSDRESSKTPQRAVQPPPATASRNASPAPSPTLITGLGGHSILAKRATSPKVPKQKNTGGSRASSPLASLSRATSPQAPGADSRATSPTTSSMTGGMPKTSVKRKADDAVASTSVSAGTSAGNAAQAPKAKKRKAVPPVAAGAPGPGVELREEMLVDWLRRIPTATTRDCIQYFQACLTTESQKARFMAMVKDVAFLKQGVLVLRNNYREPGASPGPA